MDTSHTESYEIIAISNDYSQMQISSNTSLKRITNIIENILQQYIRSEILKVIPTIW